MESDPDDMVTARYMPLLTLTDFTQITKYVLKLGSATFI